MNIYLINHPEVYNPNHACFGQSELPLIENFTVDFTWLSEKLAHLKEQNHISYFSSPFRRCTKLANYLSDGDFETDKRLSDQNFGNWELKEWQDINPTQLNKWRDDFVNYKLPKGESLNDLFDRVNAFYQELLLSEKEHIILVTHASVIKCLLCNVMGLSLQNVLDFEISNSSISKIKFDKDSYTDKVIFMNLAPAII
jgi:alpha-ribazole phosphatase